MSIQPVSFNAMSYNYPVARYNSQPIQNPAFRGIEEEEQQPKKKSHTGWWVAAGLAVAGIATYLLTRGKAKGAVEEVVKEGDKVVKNATNKDKKAHYHKLGESFTNRESFLDKLNKPKQIKDFDFDYITKYADNLAKNSPDIESITYCSGSLKNDINTACTPNVIKLFENKIVAIGKYKNKIDILEVLSPGKVDDKIKSILENKPFIVDLKRKK